MVCLISRIVIAIVSFWIGWGTHCLFNKSKDEEN